MANLSIIRELCREKNISLIQLGKEIGITTPQGVQRMINENSTTIDRLEKIAKILNVPVWQFFDLDPEQSDLKNKIVVMDEYITELNNRYLLATNKVKKQEEKITHLIVLNKNLNIMVDALKKSLESSKRIENHSEVMLKQQERMIKQLETIAIMKDFFNTVPKPDQNESNGQK